MHYHRIMSRFYNRPLMLTRASAETISKFLLERVNAGPAGASMETDGGETFQSFPLSEKPDGSREFTTPRASRFYGDYPVEDDGTGRRMVAPYRRTPEGVAIITVVGELVNRGAWIGASSGLVSYEGIKYQVSKAAADSRVHSILLDIESPGGEAVGCFELADVVRQAARSKPITAVVNGMACSAAYAMASAASKIVTMPTGISGSIGVVLLHLDFSQYLEDEGIKPTFIHAGTHKVDGNMYEPLPESVREELQGEINAFYDLFIAGVVKGRKGKMNEKAVRGTEARTYMGQEAVEIGLADEVGTFESVLADLNRASSGRSITSTSSQRTNMSDTTGAPDASKTGFTQADLDNARADGKSDGLSEGKVQGEKTAYDRLQAIMGNEKVKGRERAALDLAIKSPTMSADDVVGFVAENVRSGPSLATRMASEPSLGHESQTREKPPAATLNPSSVYGDRRKAVGQ